MDTFKVVVIGGSAGGVEAAMLVARSLPPDLDAAVFISIHIPATVPSALPELFGRRSEMIVKHATDGERIQAGRIYVAPPDRHLLIEADVMRLGRGAYENGHRPAIDPLFRTAARHYGARVIGVILSGNLDDGTDGLRDIRKRGGFAIVQAPADAVFSGMPSSAIEIAGADEVLPAQQIAGAITARVDRPVVETGGKAEMPDEREMGSPSPYSCPDCGGVLWDLADNGTIHFRCRVGHAYSEEGLLDAQSNAVEKGMWSALRALEENAAQARDLAQRMTRRGQTRLAQRFINRAVDAEERAAVIRRALLHVTPADDEKQVG